MCDGGIADVTGGEGIDPRRESLGIEFDPSGGERGGGVELGGAVGDFIQQSGRLGGVGFLPEVFASTADALRCDWPIR